MEQRICHIVGAGPYCLRGPQAGPGDLVIAADGGYAHLLRWGIPADLVVGDFDSMPQPNHPAIVRLPKEKDETDMAAAVRLGRGRGYGLFHLYGGLGGLLDHTLANLQLVAGMAQSGARGILFDDQIAVTALHNGRLDLAAGTKGRVSVFAYGGEAQGVSLWGLKYPLADAGLSPAFPLGVSNEADGGPACIVVKRGTLLVVYPRT